jgi:hypothetical protein
MIAPFLPLIVAITAASVVAEDLWGAFKGRDSLIGSVVSSISQSVTAFAKEAPQALTKGFKEAFASINKEFDKFSEWLTSGLLSLAKKANEFIAALVPDFLKHSFSATMKHILPQEGKNYGPHRLNDRLKPEAFDFAQHNQQKYSNTNNVSVAVNVKTDANAHEISSEISKALHKELERERFNAFMGVMHYAG